MNISLVLALPFVIPVATPALSQTSHDPLVWASREPLGIWSVDASGPLAGRIGNGGSRFGL